MHFRLRGHQSLAIMTAMSNPVIFIFGRYLKIAIKFSSTFPASLFQLRQILSYVVPVGICLLAESYRAVDAEELVKEGRGRQPHPISGVQRPIRIQQQFLEHL